jgi:hypothetical protein
LSLAGSQVEIPLKGAAPQRFEPYFPSAAHQLIWRNWDLVPAERIAAALRSSPATVNALAKTMALDPQHLREEYWSRLRFKALRRNWDFVPYDQLTIILGISKEEIEQLLAQDAFYIANLGPKPECDTIRIEGRQSSPRILSYFRPSAERAAVEERFDFIDRLNRPMAQPPWANANSGTAFLPRIVFPYFAVFGEVLQDNEFKSYYTIGVLENIARMGLDSIWLEVVLHDVVKSSIFPEFGRNSALQLQRLNWIIAQAKRAGLGVYLYLNEPRGMPASFFRRYSEIKGAPGRPGDGLFSMCTSTKPVQRYLSESTENLFQQAAGLEGAFLITASENPTNCYSLTRHPDCPRCNLRRGPEVIAQVVDLIQAGARRKKPSAHMIAWDWSWNIVEDDPQDEIIAVLPPNVTLMVDFERGTPISREGVKSIVDEYSLAVAGPSPRAAAHIRQAHQRGIKVMAKVQVGNTWELGLLPYIPAEQLVVRKFEALRSSGISGLMESWTLGGYPSENWAVAQAFYRNIGPGSEEILERVAAELYGHKTAKRITSAWQIFSEAFQQYPFSNDLVYSSVVQYGPAHLIYFEPTGKDARILNSYDSLSWTRPFGPQIVADVFAGIAATWQRGVTLLEEALQDVPPAMRLLATRDFTVSQAAFLCLKSIANQVRFHASRQSWKNNSAGLRRMTELVQDEMRLAEQFLRICREDSRVGFEASLQYFYLPLDIQEKLVACRFMLEKQIPEAKMRLSA